MQQHKDLHIGKGLHLGADFAVQVGPFKILSIDGMLKLSEDGPLNQYIYERHANCCVSHLTLSEMRHQLEAALLGIH